ncbi:hypothetical protein J2790_004090 [Paenarthrobacter nicotinovorans]|uniref:DUF6318 family protein n=1 Tax=Micrococcaceae TaxID=1268 RepID=UPI0020C8DEDD|nr:MULTISPECIES: DUF6318 family protein [Micrococcaceae]MDR6438915.1 hypothetical protein [Paenarthrobacter nicotinovorans]
MALTMAVLLSGCQGGPAPSTQPSESSSTTASPATSAPVPTASATPSAPAVYKPADAKGKAENVPVPVMPELAKENSKAGLEAFIGYYYATLSYAYETGTTEKLLPLSSPTCALCTSLRKGIEASWKDGKWIAGATIRSATVEATFDPSASTQVAAIQVIQEPIEIRDRDGSLYQDPTGATNSASRAAMTFDDQRWLLVDLGLIR